MYKIQIDCGTTMKYDRTASNTIIAPAIDSIAPAIARPVELCIETIHPVGMYHDFEISRRGLGSTVRPKTLAHAWRRAARFYTRFGITEGMLRCGVPDRAFRASADVDWLVAFSLDRTGEGPASPSP